MSAAGWTIAPHLFIRKPLPVMIIGRRMRGCGEESPGNTERDSR